MHAFLLTLISFIDFSGIVEAVRKVGHIVKQVLSESGYTPSGEVTFDTNRSKPMYNTNEFGYAYQIAKVRPIEIKPKAYSSGTTESVLGSFGTHTVRPDMIGCT
jgi:hypothetical protein